MIATRALRWIPLLVALVLATAGAASGKPTVPECEDLFGNMLMCGGLTP